MKSTHEFERVQNGRVPEWFKGTGCKPVGSAYLGSNPSAPTIFLARVAQSVEHLVGNEEVTGSSPVAGSTSTHPSWGYFFGGVAQLVRAHGSYPWRHWFESSHRYQFYLHPLCEDAPLYISGY